MQDLDLELAWVVHRHGERTPEWPNRRILPRHWSLCSIGSDFSTAVASSTGQDVHLRKISELPAEHLGQDPTPSRTCYDGQLTDQGKRSTFMLGESLRKAYVQETPLLPANPTQADLDNQVYSRATFVTRAQESLHNVLAGLLGSDSAHLRPLIRVRDLPNESLIPDLPACALHAQMKQAFKRLANVETEADLAALDPILVPLLGKQIRVSSSPNATETWDGLRAAEAAGIPLPPSITPEVMQTLEKAARAEWFGGYRSEKWTQLACGPLFGELDKLIKDKVSGKTSVKLSINSAHDTTVSSVLHGLHIFPGRWPTFTSNIRIELYKDRSPSSFLSFFSSPKHYVRVLYQDQPMLLPACAADQHHRPGSQGQLCTVDAFRQALNKYAIGRKDWRAECHKHIDSTDAPKV